MATNKPPATACTQRTWVLGTNLNSPAKPAAIRPNCKLPSARLSGPDNSLTTPREADSAYDVTDKLAPSTSGPKVKTAQ